MIKPEEYFIEHNIPHVTEAQIEANHSKQEYDNFRAFMYGQTYMIRPDGVSGIYACDYERWLAQGMRNEQGTDWD